MSDSNDEPGMGEQRDMVGQPDWKDRLADRYWQGLEPFIRKHQGELVEDSDEGSFESFIQRAHSTANEAAREEVHAIEETIEHLLNGLDGDLEFDPSSESSSKRRREMDQMVLELKSRLDDLQDALAELRNVEAAWEDGVED